MNPLNKLITTTAVFAAGALAMYLLDENSGRRRRAQLRARAWSGARTVMLEGQRQARHVSNRARGLVSTGRLDRHTQRPPHSDPQLHERIRAQLGRLVSHPHAIHVRVEDGHVTLSGHILRHEVADLHSSVRDMAGVVRLDNRLVEHAEAGRVPELQGSGRRASRHEPHHETPPEPMHEARPTPPDEPGRARVTTWH